MQKKMRTGTVHEAEQDVKLCNAGPTSEVGKGQREIEVLKSRTAEKVQYLRTARCGKWAAEGDKSVPMEIEGKGLVSAMEKV
ncbi:hypothetical protein B484DRAFT_404397 [Ochromonadaceae sp. CCMP2298]|nr:hypothetical protein B484DRAFT_404397 [Ochromonadaceae sp. CCMP2298]